MRDALLARLSGLAWLLVACAGPVTSGQSAGPPWTTAATPAASATPPVTAALAVPSPTLLAPSPTVAGTGPANADVLFVRATQTDADTWTFAVTVSHPDTGWEDYADGWDVVLPDGAPILPDPDTPFTRLLLHPHVDEQPFTRTQSGIRIPPGTASVRVRAHDLVHGFGGQEVTIPWPADAADTEALTGEQYVLIPLASP